MSTNSESSPLSALALLLNSELIRWVMRELIQWWKEAQFHGLYKVLDHQFTLELLDRQGHTALCTKRQTVEFQQNGVFAIQDQAWGDGEVFAAYRCSPGVAVDRYREGFRWRILISLRGIRDKGETEEFLIERTIKNGFTAAVEYFQTMIDHPTKAFTFSVVFPPTRPPKRVVLIEENAKRVHELNGAHTTSLSNGRIQYSWHSTKPRLFEGYILQWEW